MERELFDYDFQSQLEERKEKIEGSNKMKFDEEFDIEIADKDAEKMKTVGDVIKYLNK